MTVPERILEELQMIRMMLENQSGSGNKVRYMEEKVKSYDVQQVSELLHISPSTVRRYAQAGRLPHFKLGDKYMFPAVKLDEWLDKEVNDKNNQISAIFGGL